MRFLSLALVVVQQPERARLCSFKEENETSTSSWLPSGNPNCTQDACTKATDDRRPVDPPPVIELTSDGDFP